MSMERQHYMTDDELVATIASLSSAERMATATLIAHLAELESRNLHLALGFRSLYGYCRHVLHCSEHEAYNRMHAVHVARRFPVILDMLAEGRLHLTAVRLLAPHLKDEDHLALLGGAIHKSRREVVALLARWFPSADVPSSVRKLPTAAAPAAGGTLAMATSGPETAGVSAAGTPAPTEAAKGPATGSITAPRAAPAVVAPLSPARYRLQVTMSEEAHDDLRCLQDLLRRELPDGDPAVIVARALKVLRQEAEKKAFSATTRPRPGRPAAPASRDISAHVERAVWQRDQGQCSFEGSKRRCEERSYLEYHHLTPWIVGGQPSVENIALRCRAHNAYEATRYFAPIRAAMESGDAPGP